MEMGRSEHTIDGAIAIDRVYDAPGGGAFLPPASCCSFSSFALRLCCLVLEIGCSGVFGVVVVIVVVVVRLGAATGLFDWLLVRI